MLGAGYGAVGFEACICAWCFTAKKTANLTPTCIYIFIYIYYTYIHSTRYTGTGIRTRGRAPARVPRPAFKSGGFLRYCCCMAPHNAPNCSASLLLTTIAQDHALKRVAATHSLSSSRVYSHRIAAAGRAAARAGFLYESRARARGAYRLGRPAI